MSPPAAGHAEVVGYSRPRKFLRRALETFAHFLCAKGEEGGHSVLARRFYRLPVRFRFKWN